MEKVDVLIVGGGIAGLSAAATICSESNLSVLLVENKRIGSNQAIRAIFSEAIDDFGLKDSVLQNYTGFIWDSPLGATAKFDYQRVALSGVDYQKLCEILYSRAVNDGLELRKAKALKWLPTIPDASRSLHIYLNNDCIIQAQVMIDATGPAQWAARQLQVQRSQYYSLCYGELLTGCSIEEDSYFWFLAPNSRYGNGGGWLYPIGKDRVSVGYSIMATAVQTERRHLVSGYWVAKAEFQPYAEILKDGARERIEGGIIPVGRIGQFVTDRIVIIGDAGGQANPWAVEGCRPALYNGRLAAQVVMQAFATKRFDYSMLSAFEKKWSKNNRERFWRTASVADIMWTMSDRRWDQLIRSTQNLSPEEQLRLLRDNRANVFQQIYAVGGYTRRQLMEWFQVKRINLVSDLR